ncbi:MAG: carboxypeptidase regulatory-like domain-containing protein, partial [Omnitrophica WOR_2 bacterium]
MKKLLTILLLVALFAGNTYAQFVSYGFLSSTGNYNEITGGTLVGTETSDDQVYVNPASPSTSGNTGLGFPIGFNFVFNGITFDVLGINSNGWIGLGQSALTPAVNVQSTSSPLSSTTTFTPALLRNRIAAFSSDLQGQTGASMRIETIGVAPNRVCVVQYKNWKRYNTTGDVLNFQIRLLETSNEVQIVYGSMTAVATASTTEQVGLGGSVATEFFNRTSTGSWSNSYPGTSNSASMTFSNTIAPVSGQTYTFATMTPLAAVYQAPSNGALGMPIDVNLTWTPNISGGAAPVGYKVYMGSDNPPTNIANGVNVGNVLTYAAPAPLALNTLYNWQIVPYNAIGDATGNATYNFTTTLGNGDLSGFVTNGFGIPLAGVTVNINNGMSNFSTVSAANGAYTFTAVNASPYTLTATLASYNTNVLNVTVAPNTTTYQNVVMLRPAMAITPNPYSVSVNPEEMVDGALNIANNGDGLLTWNATVSFTSPGPNTWLTLGQANGTVNAYTNFSLPVAFNASGLTSGTIKTAEITFTSTPNVGTVVIPVSMTVSGAALTAPTDFTVTLSNPVTGVASLDWNFTTVPSFQYFVVKRNGVQVATTTQSNYTDNLPAYGVYSYTVQAVFADGNSIPAGPVTIEWANPTLVLTPASLYNEQYTNSSENVTFRIENTGEGTLAYSFPEYTSARGFGGPDAFGYEWIDSDESNGPAYTWTDISATGTAITGLSDDNVLGPFPIGFNFPFYENTYSSVNVSSNGYLIFGSTSSSLSNQNIPSATEPNNVLAWCWDDLHGAGTGSTVYYKNVGDHWIIQFNNYHEYPSSGTGTITAQVHLYNNGDIKIYYNNLAGGFDVTSATVGIENNAGSIATKINYNTAYIHNGLAVAIDFPVPTFITAVSPAQGQVAPGAFVDVTATFTSNDIDFPVGTHTAELELTTNDLANSTVMIPATMLVYQPGMIAGTVTSAVDGSPIFGATVTAGSYSTMTDEAGEYTITADAGTYAMTFSKTGYTSSTVTGVIVTETQTTTVDASLEEVIYPATLVHAEVNAADNQADVTWGAPNPDYEVLYDDGTAENFTAWALPGNMNAVKYTPAGYPATVYGGKIFVGDGSFPANNTGFLGTTFGAMIMDASGANGMPGVVLDSIEVTVNNYGWVEFTGLDATIESGSFYLVMVQGAASPNVAGVGVDQTTPTSYRSYSRNVLAGGAWGLSPYQDMMIRAFVNGPASDDNAKSLASAEVRTPMKQRGMISLIPALAKSGAEGQGQFLAIQGNQSSREVTSYKVWRIAVANPDAGVQSGVLTLVDDAVSTTNYADAAFGPLPEGWYGYAVAANYTNGGESVKAYSNIVGHKKLVDVTVNVSLTTGASPAGTLVTLTGSDYPTSVYTQTVTETGTVVFTGVWKGNYTVLAEKVGFDDYTVTANIQSNRTFNIILAEKKYMPRNLYVDPLTLVATWDEPLAIGVAEDFEGTTFPPAGWNSYTQNTNGWYSTTDGSSSNFIVPPHTKYAIANDDEADGDGCCDYLWTPAMDLTDLPSYRLNFASYFTGEYGQTATVEISTDNAAT